MFCHKSLWFWLSLWIPSCGNQDIECTSEIISWNCYSWARTNNLMLLCMLLTVGLSRHTICWSLNRNYHWVDICSENMCTSRTSRGCVLQQPYTTCPLFLFLWTLGSWGFSDLIIFWRVFAVGLNLLLATPQSFSARFEMLKIYCTPGTAVEHSWDSLWAGTADEYVFLFYQWNSNQDESMLWLAHIGLIHCFHLCNITCLCSTFTLTEYIKIVKIPQGATNVKIEEVKSSPYFIGKFAQNSKNSCFQILRVKSRCLSFKHVPGQRWTGCDRKFKSGSLWSFVESG